MINTDIVDKSTRRETVDKSTRYVAVEAGFDVFTQFDVQFGIVGDDGFFIADDDGGLVFDDDAV